MKCIFKSNRITSQDSDDNICSVVLLPSPPPPLQISTVDSFVEYHFITRALVCRSATANHLCEELYGLQCIQTLLQD
jgi:hypothetical protein